MKKYRNWIVSALGLLLWAVGFWMVKGDVRSTLAYVCIGLGCGMFGYGAGELIAGRVLKGAPELQRQMEIDKNDERNVAIANHAKGRAFDMMTFIFGALMVSFALMGIDLAAIDTPCTGGSGTIKKCKRDFRENPFLRAYARQKFPWLRCPVFAARAEATLAKIRPLPLLRFGCFVRWTRSAPQSLISPF